MAGPSAHGQHNKKHKSGRKAGASARDKHKSKKASDFRGSRDASVQAAARKADRLAGIKSARDKKRAEVLERKRKQSAPQVVGLLPLSSDTDCQAVWDLIIQSVSAGERKTDEHAGRKEEGMDLELEDANHALRMRTFAIPARKARMTLLPPPTDRSDPFELVEFLKAADVVLLALPAASGVEAVDREGQQALELLSHLGVTSCIGLACGAEGGSMKARSAAKKAAEGALRSHFAGSHRMYNFDSADDGQQLLRTLADHGVVLPAWRQQRPALLVEGAQYSPAEGTLVLSAYIRCAGLSANQNIHIPGAGDFQLEKIETIAELAHGARGRPVGGGAMDTDASIGMVAVADPAARDSLDRENIPNPLEGEQTWPTEEELQEAEAANQKCQRKRRLPKGTSEYQAAWILDYDSGGEEADGKDEEGDATMDGQGSGEEEGEEEEEEDEELEDEDDGTERMTVADEEETEAQKRAALASLKLQRAADDDDYPDEIDTPYDVEARVRFDKYRGLKSFRTSPWDPKESLPQEYARVFAFENFTRAHRRATNAQRSAGARADPNGVEAGTYVRIHVGGVPAEVAAGVLKRLAETLEGGRPPLVAVGLMQHECKLTVVHFLVKKAKGYTDPLANKEELIFCTGVRSFASQPIFSQNSNADKHKMERFLRAGEYTMASCYAPIIYPQMPVLVFKAAGPDSSGISRKARLAAVGSLHSCNPDRVVLKKIVLSGYPVRVHKKKATIKYMFHNPEDIKWFKPLELWTKYGRRGRIKEPIGIHGTMKCIFDGPVQQRDSVCVSLYKRAFPKWPQQMTFA
eukprot:jgi/Tetstr1/429208/TSEL_019160.t1